jgi:hypothetical protein
MPDFLTKKAGTNKLKPSILGRTRNVSAHRTPSRALPPVRTPAHLLPKIRYLKRSLKRSVEDAQGLVPSLLFQRTSQQTTGETETKHSTKTPTPPSIKAVTDNTSLPARRRIRTSQQDDQEFGLSRLSLRTKIREAQRYSKLRKATSPNSWQKLSAKKSQQYWKQEDEDTTYFRPINLADDSNGDDDEVELDGESVLYFDAVSAAFDTATVKRPRTISLTGVSASPTEVLAANDGHVVAQIRILRAKVKSKEERESSCPGE